MSQIRESFVLGYRLEQDWNERMRVCGYECGIIEVPSRPYRMVRSIHLASIAMRETIALLIAPWLDEDKPDRRIEAHLS